MNGSSASRDIEAGILDGSFQSGAVDPGWFELDGDNSGIQIGPCRADAGLAFQGSLHTGDAAIALHALDSDFQMVHMGLSCAPQPAPSASAVSCE